MLSVQLWSEKLEVYDELFHKAKVIVLTMDDFMEMISGASTFTKYFQGFVWKLAVIDEVHQLDFHEVCTVASVAEFLVLLYDRAQRIRSIKQSIRKGENVRLVNEDHSSWTGVPHRARHITPWSCLRNTDVFEMQISRRFGNANSIFANTVRALPSTSP